MPYPFRIAAALLLAVAASACEPPTREEREELPEITMGTPVEDRVIPGTSDEFALVVPAGEFKILLRARSGRAADSLMAALTDAAGNVVGQPVTSVGTDTALFAQSSGWLSARAGTEWRIRVRGLGLDDGGDYTLQLFPRDASPESVPAAIAVGQTVQGEALDVPGDVDEFTLNGTAGQEWILFANSDAGPLAPLTFTLVEGDAVVATLPIQGAMEALEGRSTGRVVLPRTGTYRVRVSAHEDPFTQVRGAYRFRVDAVNRAPEAGSAALALGAVAAEAIGSVGDVDEFRFTVAGGPEINLLVQVQSGMAAGLRFELLEGARTLTEVLLDAPTATLDERGTGRITLPTAGTYTVRVSGPAAGLPAAATGAYRFELYPVDRRPEAPGEVRLDGPTLTGTVDRPGDVDDFTFTGTAGQLVVVHGTGTAGSTHVLWADLLNAEGATLHGPAAVRGGGTSYGYRTVLPYTGTYILRLSAPNYLRLDHGGYTVGMYTVSAAPEHVPATLSVGQTVAAERIDRPGDLDVFTLTGEPGRQVNVFLGAAPAVGSIIATVRPLTEPNAYIFTYAGPTSLDGPSTGRITLQNTAYQVVVDPQASRAESNPSLGGAYGLRVFGIDRRPEGRAAAYAVGDTVRGEPVYPAGDIDEYTFQLAAATPLRVFWQGPTGAGGPEGLGNLIDEATGQSVWSSITTHNGALVRQMTLPAGRYRLVVYAPGLDAPSQGATHASATLTYTFAFIPQ